MKVLAYFKSNAIEPLRISINVDPENEPALRDKARCLFQTSGAYRVIWCRGEHHLRAYYYINAVVYARTYGPDELTPIVFSHRYDAYLGHLRSIWYALGMMNDLIIE